jgi:hypothetical protein
MDLRDKERRMKIRLDKEESETDIEEIERHKKYYLKMWDYELIFEVTTGPYLFYPMYPPIVFYRKMGCNDYIRFNYTDHSPVMTLECIARSVIAEIHEHKT